ncbi:MAG: hypothetical protein ACRC7V_00290 [Lachnospiraceae bacterium]
MRKKILDNKGASMILVLGLFLVLAGLGVNLLNATQANVMNQRDEFEKEQILLYVASIYDIVNSRIEAGDFLIANESFPDDVVDISGFKVGSDTIKVRVLFDSTKTPITSDLEITLEGKTYTISSTYIIQGANVERLSCKGLIDG